jgi:hypothetical protein
MCILLGAVPKVKSTSPLHIVFSLSTEGGAVSLDLKRVILSSGSIRLPFGVAWFLLLCASPGVPQKTQSEESSLPKYDLHTEMKTKGVIDEVNLLSVGTRKDFTELIIKNGDDKVHIYVCPKPFQEEIGISFSKGDQIAVTGSKVKQEASDVILARELVRGTDTLLFRDEKGNPVWNWRTGK